MNDTGKTNPSPIRKTLLAGLCLLAIGVVSGLGSYIGNRWASPNVRAVSPIDLHASGAVGNDRLSLATGLITAEVEGLWLLDHETGILQCWVLNPKTGAVGGIYATNVAADLELGKGKSELLMTSGNFFFNGNGRSGNLRPANSICYVANASSGVIAGYSAAINNQAIKRGIATEGPLTRVCYGRIGEGNATRDQ